MYARAMNRASLLGFLCAGIVLGACRPKKEPSFEESFATFVKKYGLQAPDATSATVPLPEEGILVIFDRDALEVDTPRGVASLANLPLSADSGIGDIVMGFDRTRAATEGADAKYKRAPKEPYIVPLANVIGEKLEKGVPKRMIVAGTGAPPPQLYKEVVATFVGLGVTEGYRIVRAKDGKIAAERLP